MSIRNNKEVLIDAEVCKVDKRQIKKELFSEKRGIFREENLRILIVEALEKVKEDSFCVVIPKKSWEYKIPYQHEKMAKELSGHIAEKNEYVLYLAQKISSGKTWEQAQKTECNLLIYDDGKPITISPRFIGMAELGMPAVMDENNITLYRKNSTYEPYYDGFNTVPMIIIASDSST